MNIQRNPVEVQNTTINLNRVIKHFRFICSKYCAWRQPEPYKRKGILYKGESLRKAGKSAK
jgi:hypothetical protein